MVSVGRTLSAHKGRVVARPLASITGTVPLPSMHLSWDPVTQLYTTHMYALINSVWTLNYWVLLTEGVINKLFFWKGLPRLRFAGPIWPPTGGLSIRMASDASDIGWGGHIMQGVIE